MMLHRNTILSRSILLASVGSLSRPHGDGGEEKVTLTKAELQAQIQAEVEKNTTGLKTKNTELLDTINKSKPLLDLLGKLGGEDDIKGLLQFKTQIEKDDILKLIKEGKHQEAIDKALEKEKVTWSAERKTLDEQLKAEKTRSETLDSKLSALMIDKDAISEFIAVDGLKEASEDVILRARMVFKVENGEVVARGSDGKILQGEKGPLTIKEWAAGLKKTAPHLFPGSASAGGKGGKGGGGGGNDGDHVKGRAEAAKKGPEALRAYEQEHKLGRYAEKRKR
jgi:hypothetical protein